MLCSFSGNQTESNKNSIAILWYWDETCSFVTIRQVFSHWDIISRPLLNWPLNKIKKKKSKFFQAQVGAARRWNRRGSVRTKCRDSESRKPAPADRGTGWASLGNLPWQCRCRITGRLTNPDTTQVQIQGSELAHPNIYPMSELLECVKGPVL